MPPRKSTSPSASLKPNPPKPTKPSTPRASPTSIKTAQNAQKILQGIWNNYLTSTPQRVKLIDFFLAFLILVGALQFAYCVLAGNYPFNAFLSGFSATVGQFVLTASLRMQTNPENQKDFEKISHERAFADFVFGSMILHFFCVNFIN
ncbi:uncharacterized protein MYCFIDRAFT_57812 [Pseudocercospora fijiensis CIRAD86]|uniref:Dolichyl-diphosphooligosaccharide--protein glycosyltransferase subunit OST2 n=1 Tax=Pseudocercospora fijiensis (strain CIRAD86) TaxID=383855 RepID=M3ANU0_PSEFD|nr:uncharacterized protein MYCFIDRAFT_57812 [Pseudocercospora fijiensis CIRAD86]EME79132.1 hypothetical protein MYCFIDRAFT_57812 [Pseudocercospora fijiensis CIRAD86]